MYVIEESSEDKPMLCPVVRKWRSIREPYNQCRQILPSAFIHNGCVDIIKVESFLSNKSITGNNIYPYVMKEENIDIDSEDDWTRASNALASNALASDALAMILFF